MRYLLKLLSLWLVFGAIAAVLSLFVLGVLHPRAETLARADRHAVSFGAEALLPVLLPLFMCIPAHLLARHKPATRSV